MKAIYTIFFLIYILYLSSSKIQVFEPRELKEQLPNDFPFNYGNFGIIPYGSIMGGRVFHFSENSNACRPFTHEYLEREGDPDQDFSPILIVERGSCSFVTKAKNAQELGASAVIIINTNDEPPINTIMIDDGRGVNIVIPTLLIKKSDGEKILKAIKKNEEQQGSNFVVLLIDFDPPEQQAHVQLQIYYTPTDSRALLFFKEFQQYAKLLKETELEFIPHLSLTKQSSNRDNMQDKCAIDSNAGLYCLNRRGQDSMMTGKEKVEQGIREICLYRQMKNDKQMNYFWKFKAKEYSLCSTGPMTCFDTALSYSGISRTDIDSCYRENYDSILQSEAISYSEVPKEYDPAILINKKLYRGALNATIVFAQICEAFPNMPENCAEFMISNNPAASSRGGIGKGTIILIVLLVIGLNVLIIYCYRRYSKREQKEEIAVTISSMMSQYFALADNKDKPQESTVKPS